MEEKWYKGRSQIGFVNLENYLDAMKRRLSLSLRILMIYSGLQVKIYYNLAVEKYRGPIFTRRGRMGQFVAKHCHTPIIIHDMQSSV
jgi:hypothetical protein